MTKDEAEAQWKAWVASRPEKVQKLIAEFPPNSLVMLEEKPHHILGWTEDDMLILTDTDPGVDYDLAMQRKVYIHAHHLRPH